jgi:hypothetical protein
MERSFNKICMMNYQQLGLLFRDDEYYVPPRIEEPDDDDQLTFMEKAELETKVKTRTTHIQNDQ